MKHACDCELLKRWTIAENHELFNSSIIYRSFCLVAFRSSHAEQIHHLNSKGHCVDYEKLFQNIEITKLKQINTRVSKTLITQDTRQSCYLNSAQAVPFIDHRIISHVHLLFIMIGSQLFLYIFVKPQKFISFYRPQLTQHILF